MVYQKQPFYIITNTIDALFEIYMIVLHWEGDVRCTCSVFNGKRIWEKYSDFNMDIATYTSIDIITVIQTKTFQHIHLYNFSTDLVSKQRPPLCVVTPKWPLNSYIVMTLHNATPAYCSYINTEDLVSSIDMQMCRHLLVMKDQGHGIMLAQVLILSSSWGIIIDTNLASIRPSERMYVLM